MKKLVIIISCFFILCGCQKSQSVSLEDYNAFVEALENHSEFNETSTYFNTTLIVNQMENGQYRYDIVIDEVKETLNKVKVLCMDNGRITEYYPSLGVYDEEVVTLANYTDKENHIYQGINLSGITDDPNVVVNILIEFEDQNQKIHQEYIQLREEVE